VHSDDFTINGKVGELIDEKGISLKIDEIDANLALSLQSAM
jgi:tyrosine-protein kinase Etk/Wzc